MVKVNLKEGAEVFLGNAGAGVLDFGVDELAIVRHAEEHLATLIGELDRVGDEVEEHLPEPQRIAHTSGVVHAYYLFQSDLLLLGLQGKDLRYGV